MTDYVSELRDLADVIDAEDSKAAAMETFADRVLAWQSTAREEDGREITFRDVDRSIGRGNDYTGRIVRWRTSGADTRTPFAEPPEKHERREERRAKRVLQDADDETLDKIVRSLPPERREKLAEAVQRDGAQEAVDTSFDVQVAKALTQLARVDVLRREGKTFTNLNATKAKRLDRDLEQGIETLAEVRGLVPSAGVRAA